MIDRDKIVKGLESQLDDLRKYADDGEVVTLTQHQVKDILALLKKDEERFKQLEFMNVTVTGNGTAIGVVQGGLVVKQSTKEIHKQCY